MKYNVIDLSNFVGRERELEKVIRYSMQPTMIYRTNLIIHCNRVSWILEELIPFVKQVFPEFNIEFARTLALVHDDAELITSDINLENKLKMSAQQLDELDRQEEEAIDELTKRFPKTVNHFVYQELLLHALHKESLEAQVVSLADKLEAYGESVHEVFAGNLMFLCPAETYTRLLREFDIKFPQLKPLFELKHPLLTKPEMQYFASIAHLKGSLHTQESIMENTNLPHYEFWKKITVERMGEEGIQELTMQKEFMVCKEENDFAYTPNPPRLILLILMLFL